MPKKKKKKRAVVVTCGYEPCDGGPCLHPAEHATREARSKKKKPVAEPRTPLTRTVTAKLTLTLKEPTNELQAIASAFVILGHAQRAMTKLGFDGWRLEDVESDRVRKLR